MSLASDKAEAAYPSPTGDTPLTDPQEIARAAVRSGLATQARLAYERGFRAGLEHAEQIVVRSIGEQWMIASSIREARA